MRKTIDWDYEFCYSEPGVPKPPVSGQFTIVDSHGGSGGSLVFILQHTDGKKYEVAFKDLKPFLNGIKLEGELVAGRYLYNWGFNPSWKVG